MSAGQLLPSANSNPLGRLDVHALPGRIIGYPGVVQFIVNVANDDWVLGSGVTSVQMLAPGVESTLLCREITHVWGDVVRDQPELGCCQRKSLERLPASLRVGERAHSRIRAVQDALRAELADAHRDLL